MTAWLQHESELLQNAKQMYIKCAHIMYMVVYLDLLLAHVHDIRTVMLNYTLLLNLLSNMQKAVNALLWETQYTFAITTCTYRSVMYTWRRLQMITLLYCRKEINYCFGNKQCLRRWRHTPTYATYRPPHIFLAMQNFSNNNSIYIIHSCYIR